ncbi:hypothetical protein TVAG_428680 [Trichomonas vaginalis G3]|uniref:Uncharacterized protein n=1 Tax=Trichomonas vaginalis (strain ATCC PRA-98 / G3) TaxID=412133 RepID=A2FJ58_TRIV3|nr:hypothetical protein TVAGG3_0914640 [Trichomonas vaginalis G3]EAX95065.1 hypothetical protein TVAG_428680 [Trichomonas vaginalis G3]KAI5484693.1 hypothetical protein TVAGG3_0914640 [Trichomonas vaginalis G3]|eukprot:XP_001307995.1 hypothetical protein [Trichomonas vaginalis G3]
MRGKRLDMLMDEPDEMANLDNQIGFTPRRSQVAGNNPILSSESADNSQQTPEPRYNFGKASYFQRNFAKRLPKQEAQTAEATPNNSPSKEPATTPATAPRLQQNETQINTPTFQPQNSFVPNPTPIGPQQNDGYDDDVDADIEDNEDPSVKAKILKEKKQKHSKKSKHEKSSNLDPEKPAFSSQSAAIQVNYKRPLTSSISADLGPKTTPKTEETKPETKIENKVETKPLQRHNSPLKFPMSVPVQKQQSAIDQIQKIPENQDSKSQIPQNEILIEPLKPDPADEERRDLNRVMMAVKTNNNIPKISNTNTNLVPPTPQINPSNSSQSISNMQQNTYRGRPTRTTSFNPLKISGTNNYNEEQSTPSNLQPHPKPHKDPKMFSKDSISIQSNPNEFQDVLVPPNSTSNVQTPLSPVFKQKDPNEDKKIPKIPIQTASIDSFFSAAAYSISEAFSPPKIDMQNLPNATNAIRERSVRASEAVSRLTGSVEGLESSLSNTVFQFQFTAQKITDVVQKSRLVCDKNDVLLDKMKKSAGTTSYKMTLLQIVLRVVAVLYWIVMLIVTTVVSPFSRKKREKITLQDAQERMEAARENLRKARQIESETDTETGE